MKLEDRKPAVAGMFYEDDAGSLSHHLKELFSGAKEPLSKDEVAALIVPHAGYVFSGGVAASGFNQISSDTRYERVFLIGSSHRSALEGASVYTSGDYITPLGRVEVDGDVAHELVSNSHAFSSDPAPHIEEHSLEVQLPFLQYHLKHPFKLVPIIMGPHDAVGAAVVAEALKKWFGPGNLFVVSTDFSHYPEYEDAEKVDLKTANAIIENSPHKLLMTIEENRKKRINGLATSLCGWTSVLTLLNITEGRQDIHFEKVEYKNSGDTRFGEKERVVGYHALAVFRGDEPKNETTDFSLNEDEKQWLLKRAHYVLKATMNNQNPDPPGEDLTETLNTRAGAFVSLYKDGNLRGCIGNFDDKMPLWEVIDRMTVSAALNDSRFSPVTAEEVDEIDIEISVLSPMREVSDISQIVPGKHGIVIKKGGNSGTFLPQVAIKTGWGVEELLGHCSRDKAGIGWDGWKDANIYIYEAFVFGDNKKT